MCTADLKGIIAFRRVPFSCEKCTISEYRKNISEISQKISEFFPEMSEIILKNSDVFAKLSEKRQQMLQEVEKASCSAPKYIAQNRIYIMLKSKTHRVVFLAILLKGCRRIVI